jgi:hypothetical protein
MTEDANPDEPTGPQVLAQFLRDWTRLWQQEVQAQGRDPEGKQPGAVMGIRGSGLSPDLSAAMELFRSAAGVWAETLGAAPAAAVRSRDRTIPPRSSAAAAASDPRDAEIERLVCRIDELEARLAKLEAPRRRRG